VSGDGTTNFGPPPGFARDQAADQDVTINGLPITGDDPAVVAHYEKEVIGGPGAFIVPVSGFAQFGEAVVRKLVLEIAAAPALPKRA
jgi:hypothetical protein